MIPELVTLTTPIEGHIKKRIFKNNHLKSGILKKVLLRHIPSKISVTF